MVCFFTGHRIIPKNEYEDLQNRLETQLIKCIDEGFCHFGAGGALGFDTLAALTVLKLREKYTHIKLILVLPCKDQTKSWKENDTRVYNEIFTKADKIVYTSEEYTRGCMQKRNRHLADNADLCICYMSRESGGTAYTVNYARKKGIKVINLHI